MKLIVNNYINFVLNLYNLPEFYNLIDKAIEDNLTFIADPILDPVSYGFTKSLMRYVNLREKYPDYDSDDYLAADYLQVQPSESGMEVIVNPAQNDNFLTHYL